MFYLRRLRLQQLEQRTAALTEANNALYTVTNAIGQLYPTLNLPPFCIGFVLLCCVVLCCVVLCCVVLCFVLFCFVLFCFVLSCLVLSCLVLFCLVLSCFVLSCFVLSFHTFLLHKDTYTVLCKPDPIATVEVAVVEGFPPHPLFCFLLSFFLLLFILNSRASSILSFSPSIYPVHMYI